MGICPVTPFLPVVLMTHRIPFHGRLVHTGGYTDVQTVCLLFRIYLEPTGGAPMWEELHPEVACQPDGSFSVMLGDGQPVDPARIPIVRSFLAVHLSDPAGRQGPEQGARTPLAAAIFAARLAVLEERIGELLPLRRRFAKLRRRLKERAGGEGAQLASAISADLSAGISADLSAQISAQIITQIDARLDPIDGPDGRLARIADEVEDLVGADGDLADIYERLERLEGSGPLGREEVNVGDLARRFAAAEQALSGLLVEGGLMRRTGDQMSGPLRTPRLTAEIVEAREVVIEGARPLQIRQIEGRPASPGAGGRVAVRKEPMLLLNHRSGAEVVVGREEGAGLRVFGPIRGQLLNSAWIERLPAPGLTGDVSGLCLRLTPAGISPTLTPADPDLLGLCLRLVDGDVEILIQGRGRVLVTAPIPAGTWLQAGPDGYAIPAPDTSGRTGMLGQTLSAARNTEQGWIVEVLIRPR